MSEFTHLIVPRGVLDQPENNMLQSECAVLFQRHTVYDNDNINKLLSNPQITCCICHLIEAYCLVPSHVYGAQPFTRTVSVDSVKWLSSLIF